MSHQTEALRRRSLRPFGYADAFADVAEMGCGKTFVILAEWQEMINIGYVTDLLVAAPAGCIRNWYQNKSKTEICELQRHLDPALLKRLIVAGWGNTNPIRNSARLLMEVTNRPRALFVNVEAISTNQEVVDLCAEFLGRGNAMMVVDESTVIRADPKVKKTGSIRTKRIVLDLAPLAKVRRILTGLMTPKNPLDLFWQFHFLDPKILGYDSFVAFRARYAKTKQVCFEKEPIIRDKLREAMGLKGKNFSDSYLRSRLQLIHDALHEAEIAADRADATMQKRIVLATMPVEKVKAELESLADYIPRDRAIECILKLGKWIPTTVKIEEFRHLDELRGIVAPFSYRVLKKDCMDIPDKIYAPLREVELTKEQRRMYDEMKKHAITELESHHVVTKNVISQMLRLHQLTLGYCKDEEGIEFDVPSNRIDALVELLDDHSGKAIIWSNYQREIAKIVKRLKEEYGEDSVAEFHGGNAKTRHLDEARFLADPACRFNVASQGAGGRGNTWINATLAVYCSNNFDLELRLQSEDRNHRKGQTRGVTYADLIVRGTVEEKIIHALRNKIDLATTITGEAWREWVI